MGGLGMEFEYDQIFYNEIIYKIEQEWGRKIDSHEKHLLIRGYRMGRMAEAENEIRILDIVRKGDRDRDEEQV
jgi:hypothetical protein